MPTQTMRPKHSGRDAQAVEVVYAVELFIVVAIVNGLLIALSVPQAADLAVLYQAVT